MIGQRFAYRTRARVIGDPVQPVEVVKEGPPRSQKVKIRYLDGEYEGLEEWVPKTRLLVPWEEAQAFCEDERRLLAVVEATEQVEGTVTYGAVGWVFGAVAELFGEELLLTGWKAIERDLLIIEDFFKTVRKLDLDGDSLLSVPCAFLDRKGDYRAPFSAAEDLARLFCRRYPKQILHYINHKDAEYRREVTAEADPFVARLKETWLDKYELELSLVREWCGEEQVEEVNQVDALREEVRRLRDLVRSTAAWLKAQGHPVKAAWVLKQLDAIAENHKPPERQT